MSVAIVIAAEAVMNAIDQIVARDVLKTLSIGGVFVALGPPIGLLVYGALAPGLIGDHVAAAFVLSYIAGFLPAVVTGALYARLPRKVSAPTAAVIGGAVCGSFALLTMLAWGATIQILSLSLVLKPALHMAVAGGIASAACGVVVARVRNQVCTRRAAHAH